MLNDTRDTELTSGILYDLDKSQRIYGLDFVRRLTDVWTLGLGAVAITNIDSADLYHELCRDCFVQLNLNYYFKTDRDFPHHDQTRKRHLARAVHALR